MSDLCSSFCCLFLMRWVPSPGAWTEGRLEVQKIVWANPVASFAVLLALPVLMFSEAKFAPVKWKLVRERGESATLRDMLTLRHIPDLR